MTQQPQIDSVKVEGKAGDDSSVIHLRDRFFGAAREGAAQSVGALRELFGANVDAAQGLFDTVHGQLIGALAENEVLVGQNNALTQTNAAQADKIAALEEAVARLTAQLVEVRALAAQDRVRAEAAEAQARHDSLTGLPNRRALDEALARMGSENIHHGGHIAAIVVDIDHFKYINDKYGHDAGDEALKYIAQVLQSNVRGDEIAARTGGDEFCILLHDFDDNGQGKLGAAVARFETALRYLSFTYEGREIHFQASLGSKIVSKADLSEHGLAIFHDADRLMYLAKRQQGPIPPPDLTP